MRLPARWMTLLGPAALLVALGCQSTKKQLPASDCELGKGGDCGMNPGVGAGVNPGVGGSGGSGASGGGTSVADATGIVAVLDSATFDHLTEYPKSAKVIAPAPGGTVEATYGGAGSTFALAGASSGQRWLFVQDQSGGASGILSTHSLQTLPSVAPLVLPVLDRQVLSNILLTQNGSPTLTDLGAQVVLLVDRNGSPASGITVTSSVFGGLIAYDVAAGVYSSNGPKKTGASGVILMFNVGAAVGDSNLTITLVDESNETFKITVPITAGAGTLASYAL